MLRVLLLPRQDIEERPRGADVGCEKLATSCSVVQQVFTSEMYTLGHPLSRDNFVLLSSGSFSYQLGCSVAAVSAQRPVEHVKHALQNITNALQ